MPIEEINLCGVVVWPGDMPAAQSHAETIVSNCRSYTNSTFESGLDRSRPEEERKALVDEFYQRFSQVVAADPGKYAQGYVIAYIHIEKVWDILR